MNINFTVLGHPEPQGSTRAFIPKGWNRAVITSDNKKLKPWRGEIAHQALVTMREAGLESATCAPVEIHAHFYFAKPKSASKKIQHKTTKPDIDKLQRSVLDALTSIVFMDDSQVVVSICQKLFGAPERVEVAVSTLG